MQISYLALIGGLLAMVSATPASKLFSRHNECDYSGTSGGSFAQGTCHTGGNYGAGECVLTAPSTVAGTQGCDFQYKNADSKPCYNAADSKYACKKDGDPCWAYHFSENPGYFIIHCTNE
ncbi:hypothetical protein F5B20DRAFT_586420 [Whalleya microplaca]|nr:hypothetical protein F5B20DRAFT_586420 [Whalleya microplaca]